MASPTYHCATCGSTVSTRGCWDTQADHEASCTNLACRHNDPTPYDCQDVMGVGDLDWVIETGPN